MTLRSVNGPHVTVVQGSKGPDELGGRMGNGDGAVRCVYLTNGASLSGFTLTNGATLGAGADYVFEQAGGGLWCPSWTAAVSNCVLAGNAAASNAATLPRVFYRVGVGD